MKVARDGVWGSLTRLQRKPDGRYVNVGTVSVFPVFDTPEARKIAVRVALGTWKNDWWCVWHPVDPLTPYKEQIH